MKSTARAYATAQHALLLVGCVVWGSTGCARVLYNYSEVERGAIYRSAQPSPLMLRWLAAGEHAPRSLINLRGDTPGFESAFAAAHAMRVYSFDWSASRPPTEEDVERLLRLLQDPENYPVLIHCRNGVDRTGYGIALYRTLIQGWDAERAVREMNLHLQFGVLNPVPQAVVRDGLRSTGARRRRR